MLAESVVVPVNAEVEPAKPEDAPAALKHVINIPVEISDM